MSEQSGGQLQQQGAASENRADQELQARFLQTGFGVVMAAILLVSLLAALTLWLSQSLATDVELLAGVMGTATTMIGTLVGSFLGIRVGQQGREEATSRAEDSRRQTERALATALAYVPPERADDVLKAYSVGSPPPTGHGEGG